MGTLKPRSSPNPHHKFGEQPILAVMIKQRWGAAALAREIGVTYAHLYNAVVGRTTPSEVLRERLPQALDASLTDLFTEESLSARWGDQSSRVQRSVIA